MAFVGDVFGLNSVYEKQVENVENSNFASWPESSNLLFNYAGYFGGGYTPKSHIGRLDVSVNMWSLPGDYTPAALDSFSNGVSTPQYGYFGSAGNQNDYTYFSYVYRLDFSNTTSSLPGAILTASPAVANVGGVQTPTKAYFAGGSSSGGSPSYNNKIEKFTFSSESISTLPSTLSTARSGMGSVHSESYGYFAAGFIGPPSPFTTDAIDRLGFDTDTTSTLPTTYPASENGIPSTSSSEYGYFLKTSHLVRLNFNTESFTTISNATPVDGSNRSAMSNSNFNTYFAGGYGPDYLSSTLRLDYGSETISDIGANYPEGGFSSAGGVSGGKSLRSFTIKSYGYTNSAIAEIKFNRVDFATDGVSLSPGMTKFNAGFVRGTAFTDLNYGYYTAGIAYPPGVFVSWTRRHDFSSETSSTPGDKCPYNARDLRSVSSKEYGYISGGQIPPVPAYFSFTARMDFSTTTFDAALSSGRNMSSLKAAHIGIQNSSYGYFGGGYKYTTETITYSTVDRLDFSTESYSLSVNLTTPTSTGLMHGNGFENGVYGYFGGGYTTPPKVDRCQIYRLDFSNETISSGGNLNSNFSRASAMSGLYDAWWMFGSPGLSGSRRSRYNYSTDTASALPDLTTGSSTAGSSEFEN